MGELELIFMGTGTSHGIPVIGCSCPVCLSPDARDKRLRTSAHLRSPEVALQIDTAPDFRTQCLRENLMRIDAVVYTHAHTDHILGFDDLRRFCEMEEKEMPVYGTSATLADLQRVFAYAFEKGPVIRTYVRPLPRPVTGPFEIGDLRVVSVDLPHGRAVTTGLVVWQGERKVLAYFTDCQSVPPAAEEAARDVEVLVIDALRREPHSTHMSIEQALAASKRIGAGRTYFTHMCHDLGHAATEAELPKNIRLAFDGLRISI